MSGLLAKLNFLVWFYAFGVLLQSFQWQHFWLFIAYMLIYYAALYWFYRQERIFEFYWVGFGCAFLALFRIFVVAREISP